MTLKKLSTIFAQYPLLPNLLIVLVALFSCASILLHGAFGGYDLEFHLIWVKHFTAQLAQGELYPRWLMDMNFGAGSPTFYYYPPLAYYITAIPGLLFPWIEVITQHAIGETAIIALSGMAFYHYAQRRFAAIPALLASLIYMILPYHFEYDLWTRQDLSEIANYIWLPLVIDYTERLFDGEEALIGLAIVYGCMMLTHLPTTLLFSLGLAGYVLVLTCMKPSWRFLAHFSTAIAIGILLAGTYWIPAVFCLKYIHAEEWWAPFYDFRRWFFPLVDAPQLNSDSQRLFDMLCLTTVIFALCWLNALCWRSPEAIKKLWPCLALVVVSWFFMSSWSRILWEVLPLLSKVQFPWRIAVGIDLATAIAVLLMMNNLYLQHDKLTILVAAVVISLLLYSLATAHIGFSLVPDDAGKNVHKLYREALFMNSEDASPHIPRWNNLAQVDENDKTIEMLGQKVYDKSHGDITTGNVAYVERNGSITVSTWAPDRILLDIDLQNPTPLTVRQLYFPNWRASVVGSGSTLKIAPVAGWGLIRIIAPAGKYQLQLKMGHLKEELIGAAMSGLALLLLSGRAVWMRWRHQARKTAATFDKSISEN